MGLIKALWVHILFWCVLQTSFAHIVGPPPVYPKQPVAYQTKQVAFPSPNEIQPVSYQTPPPYGINVPCPPLLSWASTCKPLAQCSVWYMNIIQYGRKGTCPRDYGLYRACCPDVKSGTMTADRFKDRTLEAELAEVNQKEVDLITAYGFQEASRLSSFEANLIEHQTFLTSSSPSFGYYRNMRATDAALEAAELGLMVTKATQKLKEVLHLSNEAAGIGTQKLSVKGTALEIACRPEPKCYISKYRSADGSCNNLITPNMGKSITQIERILPPKYDDGVWLARDKGMPNSRLVRVSVIKETDSMEYGATQMVMQWGQYLDHDLTHVPVFRLHNNTGIQCCTADGNYVPVQFKHPHCFVVDILPDDPFYGPMGVRCLNFIRSTVAPRSDCKFGYAEQLNQVTHWIDASQVYGSNEEMARKLRTFKGGRLRTFRHKNRDLLPLNHEDTECIGYKEGFRCFLAGDSRVNQVIGLTALQVLFMRDHNKIAGILQGLNPHWNDERLYQEARRIIIAFHEHVTYNEYLPVILGREVMAKYNLIPLTKGYTYTYDETLNAGILNEFATAAFRYGHSMINHFYDLIDESGKTYDRMILRDWFNNPHSLARLDVLDSVLRGMVTGWPQKSDDFFSMEVSDYLFKRKDKPWGFDLVAFNIWRGRDHGLPGYNAYREAIGLPKAHTFRDLTDVIPPEVVTKFESLYKTVDDIDLYIAGISERPVPGSVLGPTFTRILADQFARLKDGDRFWYELGTQVSSFTVEQLQEIRKFSLATLLCRVGDNIKNVQPLVFRPVSDTNPRVPCSQIPVPDFTPWKEY